MRKKIEELRNKEEGFTLVELLAVIVILGIIVAIAIPAVGSVIDRAGSDADEAEQALVADAARLYVTTERVDLEKDSGFGSGEWENKEIKVSDLYAKGYLEDRAGESELGESELDGNVLVSREKTEDSTVKAPIYTYTYDATGVTKADGN